MTETRAIENELREGRRRLEEAMRVAGVGSFEGRADTAEFEWSAQLFRLYGLDPAGPQWSLAELVERMGPFPEPALAGPDPPLGPFAFEYDLTRADGVLRRFEIVGEVFLEDDVKRLRGTVRDVTALRRGEAQQAALATVSRRALEGLPLDQLQGLACESAAEALGADAVGAVELRPDGSFALVAAHGVPPGLVGGDAPEDAAALARQALAEDAPVIVTDWRTERAEGRPAQVGEMEVVSSITVPVRTGEQQFGVLGAGTTARNPFSEGDTDFVLALANVLAAAIDRSRHEQRIEVLAAQRGRLVAQTLEAEERVRRQVSEAIHDGPLQELLASRQDLVEAGEGGEVARDYLERGRQGIERSVHGLRKAVQDLHPVVLQHAGLEAALMAAADHAAGTGGFDHRISLEPEAAGVRDELVLSLAHELLNNAAKHAHADEVAVTVTVNDAGILVEVTDDGVGIPEGRIAAAAREGHIGLATLSERVEAIGGRVDFGTGPGTTVRALLPMPPA